MLARRQHKYLASKFGQKVGARYRRMKLQLSGAFAGRRLECDEGVAHKLGGTVDRKPDDHVRSEVDKVSVVPGKASAMGVGARLTFAVRPVACVLKNPNWLPCNAGFRIQRIE